MPQPQIWLVKDTDVNLYLKNYNPDPHYCTWGNWEDAIQFDTLEDTAPVIATLGGETGKYIGTNPPPR